MKITKKLFLAFALASSFCSFAQVGIGTKTPAAGSILDLTSSDKALLITRVDSTNDITSPVNGMVVYENTSNSFKVFENNVWQLVVNNFNGSNSIILNGTNFERAALTGDVTAAANSNATTISDNAVTSNKILDVTIANTDLANAVGGIYKGSGSLSTTTTVTQGTNNLTFNGTGNFIKTGTGNVGIGAASPTQDLHVNGTLRLESPLQALGRVLMSDANGNATWRDNVGLQESYFINMTTNATKSLPANTDNTLPGITAYTCQKSGYYLLRFYGYLAVVGSGNGNRSIYFNTKVNGVSVKTEETYQYSQAGSYFVISYPVIVPASAGDIITTSIFSGFAFNLDATGASRTNLSIIYLGL